MSTLPTEPKETKFANLRPSGDQSEGVSTPVTKESNHGGNGQRHQKGGRRAKHNNGGGRHSPGNVLGQNDLSRLDSQRSQESNNSTPSIPSNSKWVKRDQNNKHNENARSEDVSVLGSTSPVDSPGAAVADSTTSSRGYHQQRQQRGGHASGSRGGGVVNQNKNGQNNRNNSGKQQHLHRQNSTYSNNNNSNNRHHGSTGKSTAHFSPSNSEKDLATKEVKEPIIFSQSILSEVAQTVQSILAASSGPPSENMYLLKSKILKKNGTESPPPSVKSNASAVGPPRRSQTADQAVSDNRARAIQSSPPMDREEMSRQSLPSDPATSASLFEAVNLNHQRPEISRNSAGASVVGHGMFQNPDTDLNSLNALPAYKPELQNNLEKPQQQSELPVPYSQQGVFEFPFQASPGMPNVVHIPSEYFPYQLQLAHQPPTRLVSRPAGNIPSQGLVASSGPAVANNAIASRPLQSPPDPTAPQQPQFVIPLPLTPPWLPNHYGENILSNASTPAIQQMLDPRLYPRIKPQMSPTETPYLYALHQLAKEAHGVPIQTVMKLRQLQEDVVRWNYHEGSALRGMSAASIA